ELQATALELLGTKLKTYTEPASPAAPNRPPMGLSEELCRHERKRSLCLGLREAGPPRSTAACWSATRGLRPLERRSALGNRGAARPPRTPWIGGRCRAS